MYFDYLVNRFPGANEKNLIWIDNISKIKEGKSFKRNLHSYNKFKTNANTGGKKKKILDKK